MQEFLHDIIDSLAGIDGELVTSGFIRSDTVTVPAGLQVITFNTPFPLGIAYTLAPLPGYTDDDDFIWKREVEGSKTINGFSVNFDKAVTFTYVATIVT